MANYVFENINDTQAAAFTANDFLFFNTGGVSNITATNHGAATTTDGLGNVTTTVGTTTLSNGISTHTFQEAALSGASTGHHLVFIQNSDTLVVGTSAGDNVDLSTTGGSGYNVAAGTATKLYGFDGADTLHGSLGNDTIYGGEGNDIITGMSPGNSADALGSKNDFLMGGNGADSITGSNANEHIYGNVNAGAAGQPDGNDTIHAGAGNDYVQGNAGNDTIFGEDGNDRLYGGDGNDNITGGLGNDYLQGNKGDDVLNGEVGTDELHGGQGNDQLGGGADNDLLFGEVGNDNINGGAGYDQMTGGAGNDTFIFLAGDASTADVTSTTGQNFTDTVMDFHKSEGDLLDLSITVNAVLTDTSSAGATSANVDAAYNTATGIFATAANTNDVVAIQVGADTYLFWSDNGSTSQVDEVLHLVNTTASTVATTWFS